MFVLHWTQYGTNAVAAEYTISHKTFVAGKMQTVSVIQNIHTLCRQGAEIFCFTECGSHHWTFKCVIPNSIIRSAPDKILFPTLIIMLSSHLLHTPVGHFHGSFLTFIHIFCFILQLFQSFNNACSISHILQCLLYNCERYTAKICEWCGSGTFIRYHQRLNVPRVPQQTTKISA
jgi:hypothetical protein